MRIATASVAFVADTPKGVVDRTIAAQ